MRRSPQFKIYTKSKSFLLSCPKKLLKFKKSKWNIYKNILKKNLSRRFFYHTLLVSPKIRAWDKKKQFFKINLMLKRSILQLYDNSLKTKSVKKLIKSKKHQTFDFLVFLKNSIVRFEFTLAVLLVRLNIFSNIFESRKRIDAGFVLVNNIKPAHNYILKRGDVVHFKNINFKLKKVLDSFFRVPIFIPFVEIDFYSNRIVIIKDLNNLSVSDISLFLVKHFNLSKIRYLYLKS